MLLILNITSRTLTARMDTAATIANCTAVVAYADNNGTTFTEGSTATSLNGTTAVTILAAPASGVRRIIKSICIFNQDVDTHTTTLIFNDNGTEYPITRLTLASGASWSSDDQTGVNVGGAVTDGPKGDILVSSGGTTWTIDNEAVTYAKLQTVTDARLIGRSAGSNGDAQEITVGTGLSLSAGSLTATVVGVSNGDKGDISVSDNGATWLVDARAITYAKIQDVTDARLLGRSSGTAGTAQEITVGTGLSLSQGATPTLTATGGSMVYPGAGIAVSNGTAWITPKNSPTGDVVGTSDSQALTNKTISGASNTISNINLASQVTGTLPVANGGTGATTRQAAMDALAGATTSGQYLRGDGSDVVMAALQAADLTGTVAVANGGTGQTSYSNGQLLIGNTSTGGLAKTTLTAGSNITITNGAGAITIASTASGGGGREVLTAARTYYIGYDLGAVTANATTDKIEKTAHGLENGDPVVFSAATAPDNITLGTVYYVINKATDNFEISTSAGGAKVTWTMGGTTVTCYTGKDSNPGYGTNGRTVALLTVQKFFDIVKTLDKGGYSVTGLLSKGLFLSSTQIDIYTGVGSGRVILDGDSNTTSIIRGTTQRCMLQIDAQVDFEIRKVQLDNLTGGSTSNSSLLEVVNGAVCYINGPNFGVYAGTNYRQHIWLRGGTMIPLGGWNLSGSNGGGSSLGAHLLCTAGFFSGFGLTSSMTITITNTPNFSTGFLATLKAGVIEMNTTATNKFIFSGTLASGVVKAFATLNGVIDTAGGISNLPGDSSTGNASPANGSSTATGGQVN